jgi:N-acetylneuraminic acid mutarotase
MIVWGMSNGAVNRGASYDPVARRWKPISTLDQPPQMHSNPAGVWTGSRMIVWGGDKYPKVGSWNDGGIYDPATDTWSALPQSGAIPSARSGHTAVWTGSRMIVWGGGGGGGGGQLTPPENFLNDGGSYDPTTGIWTAISTVNAPSKRWAPSAVWTGTKMIVWGGGIDNGGSMALANDGAAYDPATDAWTAISGTNAPSARYALGAVWNGSGMIVFGGDGRGSTPRDMNIYYP